MVPDIDVLGIAVVDGVFGEELGTTIVDEQWGRGGGVLFEVLHQAMQPYGLFSSFSGRCEWEHAPWCPQSCFCSKIKHFTGLYRPAPLSFIFMNFSDFQTFGFLILFNFPTSFWTLPKPEIAETVAKPMKCDTPAV